MIGMIAIMSMTTIAEARRHGHLPLVVPRNPVLAEHVDDHQQRFAQRLAEADLVRVVATAADFQVALEQALAAPRTDDSARSARQEHAQAGAREAVRRFAELVDDMFAASALRRR